MSAVSTEIRFLAEQDEAVLVTFNETLSHLLKSAFHDGVGDASITCLNSQDEVGSFTWAGRAQQAATQRRSILLDSVSAPGASCMFVLRHHAYIEASHSTVIYLTGRETICPDIGPYGRLVTAELPVPNDEGQAKSLVKLVQETWWVD